LIIILWPPISLFTGGSKKRTGEAGIMGQNNTAFKSLALWDTNADFLPETSAAEEVLLTYTPLPSNRQHCRRFATVGVTGISVTDMPRSPSTHVTVGVTGISVTDMPRTCTMCAAEFHGRADAKFCSPTCRQRAHRQQHRRYRPEPILYADYCAKVADPQRLRRSLNIMNYDAHISADQLYDTLGPHASQWADRIDDCIEWLSVVRDGLRGMDSGQRAEATVARCTRRGHDVLVGVQP
jgi:hypothetical protein